MPLIVLQARRTWHSFLQYSLDTLAILSRDAVAQSIELASDPLPKSTLRSEPGNIALADPCQIRNVPLRHLVPYADVLDYGRGPMSLILVPQVSGSVLPANVHQRVVYKKTATFDYILSIVSDLGQHRAHLGIDLEDRDP